MKKGNLLAKITDIKVEHHSKRNIDNKVITALNGLLTFFFKGSYRTKRQVRGNILEFHHRLAA